MGGWVDDRTILRSLIGSGVHGLSVTDGVGDDRDEMGVCVEPLSAMIGPSTFEQHIYRTAQIREGTPHARSRAGDLDLVIYSLRKWVRLALAGNPTVLVLVHAADEHLVTVTPIGQELRAMAGSFLSKQVGQRVLGYMQSQRRGLIESGLAGKHGNRPELVDRYGFDTKYAGHLIRLGYQGVELMTTGRLTLPMAEPTRSLILGIRRGEMAKEKVVELSYELEAELKLLTEHPNVPDRAEEDRVWTWVRSVYLQFWQTERAVDTVVRDSVFGQLAAGYVPGVVDA